MPHVQARTREDRESLSGMKGRDRRSNGESIEIIFLLIGAELHSIFFGKLGRLRLSIVEIYVHRYGYFCHLIIHGVSRRG